MICLWKAPSNSTSVLQQLINYLSEGLLRPYQDQRAKNPYRYFRKAKSAGILFL
jgi:hypothetical protein